MSNTFASQRSVPLLERTFSFRPVHKVETVLNWLKSPHVKEFWDDGGYVPDDLKNLKQGKPTFGSHWFGMIEKQPFAYLVTSKVDAGDEFEEWKTGACVTIDFIIGEKQFLEKNLSVPLLESFCSEVLFSVDSVITDPPVAHKHAIHVFKKAGFKELDRWTPTTGQFAGVESVIMRKDL